MCQLEKCNILYFPNLKHGETVILNPFRDKFHEDINHSLLSSTILYSSPALLRNPLFVGIKAEYLDQCPNSSSHSLVDVKAIVPTPSHNPSQTAQPFSN